MKSEAGNGNLTQRSQRHGGHGDGILTGVDTRRMRRERFVRINRFWRVRRLGRLPFCARPTRKSESSVHVVRSGRTHLPRKAHPVGSLFAQAWSDRRFLARANKAVRHSRRTRIPPARSFASVTYILSWCWRELNPAPPLTLPTAEDHGAYH
jgi:hypothetical protein